MFARRSTRPGLGRRLTGTTPIADGLLLVDKPAGPSSHDVVAVARRVLGVRQVGHAGTLDPFATGLLVILVGRATRLIQYLHDDPKRYEAVIVFGSETDTEDAGGVPVRQAARPTRDALLAILPKFLGELQQVPPAYSAKRIAGKRAYELARAGQDVELKASTIEIHEVALSDFEEHEGTVATCRMRVSCGGGTYIRSLARDIARAAGTAGHLSALRRHQAGVFELGRSIPFEQLCAGVAALSPTIDALEGHAVQALTPEELRQVVRGIDAEARVDGAFAALVDPSAQDASTALVAFAQRRPSERGDRWQPRVVMRDP